MSYTLLRHVHVALALLSIGGFVLRWTWRLRGSPLASHAATRVLPHVNDSLFLLAGLLLAHQAGMLSAPPPWLQAKFAGLLLYIVLGMLAMRTAARHCLGSAGAFIASLLVFSWVVSVAWLKLPLGGFELLLR